MESLGWGFKLRSCVSVFHAGHVKDNQKRIGYQMCVHLIHLVFSHIQSLKMLYFNSTKHQKKYQRYDLLSLWIHVDFFSSWFKKSSESTTFVRNILVLMRSSCTLLFIKGIIYKPFRKLDLMTWFSYKLSISCCYSDHQLCMVVNKK